LCYLHNIGVIYITNGVIYITKMNEVRPIRGLMYDPRKVSMADVSAPPYDIITPRMQDALYDRSQYNIVRVDFGRPEPGDMPGGRLGNMPGGIPGDIAGNDKYVRAAKFMQRWMDEGVLGFWPRPAFYLYEAAYTVNTGTKAAGKTMRGVFAAVRLVELGRGVFPHEKTRSKPKEDRLNLMRACMANTSPVFSIYDDPRGEADGIFDRWAQEPPYYEFSDDEGVGHRLWVIDDEADVALVSREIGACEIFIADGHHRYETALTFQEQMKDAGGRTSTDAGGRTPTDAGGRTPTDAGGRTSCGYVLMYLVNSARNDMTIFATHRLLRSLPKDPLSVLENHFSVERIDAPAGLSDAIAGRSHCFGLYLGTTRESYVLQWRGEGLDHVPEALRGVDVEILHELILQKLYNVQDLEFEMDAARAVEKVDAGEFRAAILLNPTAVADVERAARMGHRLPPKSTYFYPKIPTGLVINRFEG
jgi:uncharacterized protein (DUF1015 family)